MDHSIIRFQVNPSNWVETKFILLWMCCEMHSGGEIGHAIGILRINFWGGMSKDNSESQFPETTSATD